MSTKTCNICIEDFNENEIKSCPYCEYEACINCIKKYSIESIKHTDKKCMNCKKKFTRHTLVNFFGKTYVNGLYKDHIKDLLFKEEKTLIPRSLPIVERNKKIRLQKKEIEYLKITLNNNVDNKTIKRNSQEHFIELAKINGLINYHLYINNNDNFEKKKKEITIKYKYPCANNNCNGFVNDKWYCELCDLYTCKECLVLVNENHICNNDDLNTAKLIKSQSKPCPKCNISIAKTSGCDQMWCVSCHTTFDWKTLEIKNSGVLHNPEYFRYMRENGLTIARNPNDIPCNNEYLEAFHKLSRLNQEYKNDLDYINTCKNSTYESLKKEYIQYNLKFEKTKSDKILARSEEYANRKLQEYSKYLTVNTISKIFDENMFLTLFSFIREINHMEDNELRNYRRKINNYESFKDDLRVEYIEKRINETKYKIDLARKHKEIEFLNEFISHQETIIEVCKSFAINFINKMVNHNINKESNKSKLYLYEDESYLKLIEFVEDIKKVTNETKDIYGYKGKQYYLPNLVKKVLIRTK